MVRTGADKASESYAVSHITAIDGDQSNEFPFSRSSTAFGSNAVRGIADIFRSLYVMPICESHAEDPVPSRTVCRS